MAPLMFFKICRSAWLALYRNSRYSEMGSSPDRMLASFRNRVKIRLYAVKWVPGSTIQTRVELSGCKLSAWTCEWAAAVHTHHCSERQGCDHAHAKVTVWVRL